MIWGVTGLTVRFGDVTALDAVDLETRPGRVTAVVGGDGAGKTTLLRVLAGVRLRLTGTVTLPPPGRIGYVPPQGGVFGDLTVHENMQFVAGAYRIRTWRDRAEELLESAGIADLGDRLARSMSGGERRKLAGSMALLPEPDLLVLDEVTTGVDPVSRMHLWRLVAGAAARGTGVVLATTYLDEAERAGSAVLLHRGTVIGSGSPADITAAMPGRVEDVASPTAPGHAWRYGRRWRQWDPEGTQDPAPRLEDAAIVAELRSEANR